MKKKYVIYGEPFSVAKIQKNARRVWDQHEQALLVRKIDLQKQHGENEPLYTGNIKIDATFYFMTPCGKKGLQGKKHTGYPPIGKLLTFIERVGQDILFDKSLSVVEISATKEYDYEPRTEFYVIKE